MAVVGLLQLVLDDYPSSSVQVLGIQVYGVVADQRFCLNEVKLEAQRIDE